MDTSSACRTCGDASGLCNCPEGRACESCGGPTITDVVCAVCKTRWYQWSVLARVASLALSGHVTLSLSHTYHDFRVVAQAADKRLRIGPMLEGAEAHQEAERLSLLWMERAGQLARGEPPTPDGQFSDDRPTLRVVLAKLDRGAPLDARERHSLARWATRGVDSIQAARPLQAIVPSGVVALQLHDHVEAGDEIAVRSDGAFVRAHPGNVHLPTVGRVVATERSSDGDLDVSRVTVRMYDGVAHQPRCRRCGGLHDEPCEAPW